jgi:predicted DNA-binding ribbon-helix-helix protein
VKEKKMINMIEKVIVTNDVRTTIRLAEVEWAALEDICQRENVKNNELIEQIDKIKAERLSLTEAVQAFSTNYFFALFRVLLPNNSNKEKISPLYEGICSII